MKNSATLLVMAAGMGSRFGGLKQAAKVGPKGEMIIDYSIFDAQLSGFDKAVFVIRKDIEKEFRDVCGRRIEKIIDTEYVFQEKDNLPSGYTAPSLRLKPWGTGQAVLCARNAVTTPFLVINADDYYGRDVYQKMHDGLVLGNEFCMAGYILSNTLSENGSVSRGICTSENGYLKSIKEMTDITKDSDIPGSATVSMNMWGLYPRVFDYLESGFEAFLKDNINEPKKEFYLPECIGSLVSAGKERVKIIPTDEQWLGITYSEDLPYVKSEILKMRGDIL